MNAQPAEPNVPDASAPSVDDKHPWLGLASFTEETRSYFFGREEEVAELARRVQRKLLTILFGQSGLGKTSILRAGLVPRLRGHGYCPVYVRIDYSRDAPEPAEQIKHAIAQTARRSGEWTQTGVAAAGESLWEFLHHRDDVLQDEAGKTLIPLLIFDQFEEIFTLAQTDEFGRARAARFIADLADLVENRPPQAVEAKLETDDSMAERFDFARSDYRVLIALREDYLAPLEGLKSAMPSVTQNRLRLAPMTGTQGLQAVLLPGKRLVSQEVAEAIVRFVAGGSELANAEVEPSLLSLVCRELNDTRIAQGRNEISLDLLAGSHATILSTFYERALADQPAAVRRIIEDDLLTDSGFRENVAEERLRTHFAAAGASPDTLAVLVNRRLLRIEERLDVRRVELTHDVLCSVVKSSRDLRHERESREATEKMLAEQRERELAARHALVRARKVAAACIVLAIGAIVAAIFAYWSTQRAQRAERLAQQSRVQAERLLGFLTDNFARELESSGRLDVVESLAKREVDYFHGLPPELKGPDTVRTGAKALVQLARASRTLGKLDVGSSAATEATALLEGLRRDGDTSEATTIALARALGIQARILGSQQDPAAIPTLEKAFTVLQPLADKATPSLAVAETEVWLLTLKGFALSRDSNRVNESIQALERAMRIGVENGALQLENLYMSTLYAEAGAWRVSALIQAGRNEEARLVGADNGALADRILALRPGNLSALFSQAITQGSLGDLAMSELRPADAVTQQLRGLAVQRTLTSLDPSNAISQNNLASGLWGLGDAYWVSGQPRESLQTLEEGIAAMHLASKGGVSLQLNEIRMLLDLSARYAIAGKFSAAENAADVMGKTVSDIARAEPKDSNWPAHADLIRKRTVGFIALVRGDPQTALQISSDILPRIQAMKGDSDLEENWKNASAYFVASLKARAELAMRRYPQSERSARQALQYKKNWQFDPNVDQRLEADESVVIALSLASQGRIPEAQQVIEPVVKMHRGLYAHNHGEQEQKVEFASALYVQALTDSQHRAALLREAIALLNSLPKPMEGLYHVREWRNRIQDAMH